MGDFSDRDNLRAMVAEFLATFILVFIGVGAIGALDRVGSVSGLQLLLVGLAHGLAIAVGVMAFGRISGAHINPAVTIAALLTGRIGLVKSSMYVVAQLGGGVVAMIAIDSTAYQSNDLGLQTIATNLTTGNAFVVEFILTFLLVFTIFATAMEKRANALFAPLAIGTVVAFDHFVAIPLTGASMNPARAFGPALVHGDWTDQWLYWAAPITGAVIAGIVYVTVFGTPEDRAQAGVISLSEAEVGKQTD